MLAEVNPFIQSLEHIAGFLMVLVALGLLWAVTVLLGRVFGGLRDPLPPKMNPLGGPGGPNEEELVAITAAISLAMGQRSRVVSLRSSTKDWSREGLRDHFASHKIR